METETWTAVLDSLDGADVRFVSADTGEGGRAVLTIDRSTWEALGRPSTLTVTISDN